MATSNDYTNSEEINKLKKGEGRASAKISAYQVRNIIHLFEKSDPKDATNKATSGSNTGSKSRTLPAALPSSGVKTPVGNSSNPNPTASNGVVLRVHNNLAASKSHPATGTAAARIHHPTAGAAKTLPGKLLNVQQRPQSTQSMDSDGYMKPVLDISSHASYIDLIPDPRLNNTNNANNSSSRNTESSDEEPLYDLTSLPLSRS